VLKRDSLLTSIKNAVTDINSPLFEKREEILIKVRDYIDLLNILYPKDVRHIVNKVITLRVYHNASDEDIANEIAELKPEEVYNVIKHVEQVTANIFLSVIADYVIELGLAKMSLFYAQQEQPQLDDVTEDMLIRDAINFVETYKLKYTIDSTNMKRKSKKDHDDDMYTLF
jgi:hypothetical protein